jgi:hypothetical protein
LLYGTESGRNSTGGVGYVVGFGRGGGAP